MHHKINRKGTERDEQGHRLCDPICRLRGTHAECRGPRAVPFDRVGYGTPGKRLKTKWRLAGKPGSLRGFALSLS